MYIMSNNEREVRCEGNLNYSETYITNILKVFRDHRRAWQLVVSQL